MTSELVAGYRRDGYAVVDAVLDDDLLAEARAAADEFEDRARSMTESDDILELEPFHHPDVPAIRRLRNPSAHHPVFARIMRSDAVLDVVEAAVGPDIRFQADKLNYKSPGGGVQVKWHQDLAYGPCTNDDVCAVGIALDDATEENGCLWVVPGSNRGPVHDHHRDGRFVGAVDPTLDVLTDAIAVPLTAGAMSIHHGRTLHGSSENRSVQPRRLLLFQFAAADAFPIGPAPSPWPSLAAADAAIVRGRPSRIARCIDMDVPIPIGDFGGASLFTLQEAAP